MNIVVVNHYAGSPLLGMEFRPYYLAKEWIRMGHKVMIVGGSFSHLRKQQPKVGEDIFEGIRYVWIKTPKYKNNGIKRFFSMLSFVGKLYCRKKLFKDFEPDVVISSSTYPLDIFPCYSIAKACKAKLVYEIHDLWPLTPMILGGMKKTHPFIMLMQYAEDFAYKHCHKTVSILPCVEEYTTAHGLDKEKLFLVPNGIFEEDWIENREDVPEQHSSLIEKLKSENKFIIAYVGGHAISNALDKFIEAKTFISDPNIAFVLVGDGQEKAQLMENVRAQNIKDVYFLPPITKWAIPNMLSLCDVLYMSLGHKGAELYRFGMSPNKIFDYLMAEKPIILYAKVANNIVKDANCGWTVEDSSTRKLAQCIELAYSTPKEKLKQMGKNAKDYVWQNHRYSILSKKFIEAIEK